MFLSPAQISIIAPGARRSAAVVAFLGVLTCGWSFRSAGLAAKPPERIVAPSDQAADNDGSEVTDRKPVVLFGTDGLTPLYIEDPVNGYGIPIPTGPQHDADAVRGSLEATRVSNRSPQEISLPGGTAAMSLIDGSSLPLDKSEGESGDTAPPQVD